MLPAGEEERELELLLREAAGEESWEKLDALLGPMLCGKG